MRSSEIRTTQSPKLKRVCRCVAHFAIWAPLAALLLSGCTVGPKYHKPSAPVPTTYKENPDNFPEAQQVWKVADSNAAMLRGKWWEIFSDSELNTLEEQLDKSNQTVAQAYYNYIAAREIVQQARSQFFPTIGASPAISRQRSSANLGAGVPGSGGTGTGSSKVSATNLFELPGTVSWEPDLWGKVRNTVAEEAFAAQVSAADLANTKLSQESSLAQLLFEIRGQDALQKLFDDTVAADRKTVDYAQAQYDTGVGDKISLVEAQTALQSAEASAIAVRLSRAQFEHAVAVLIGKPPAEVSIPVRILDSVPPPVPLGMPSHLLERRPDVAASERTMAEANAQIGIAYAAYYPNVTLSASGGFESSIFTSWFAWPSRFWSIGTSLSETIFDAGLRRATVRQFIAIYNADVAGYRQTVLTAFQQVEDELAAERILSEETEKQKQAVGSAQQFFDLEYDRYQTGIDPYIDVLTAQNTLLGDQQTLVNLQTQRMTSEVQLIIALGGGWESSDLPTPAQVTLKPAAVDVTKQQ
ncbi:MAG TPA: efflux transporter outer membrane subunit [Candidatus Eremiobacteraceae bacterium]|jgi:NodT family efflux transporter outer membrane factor (OMF) lipoprotein|nr:efflux transporter outer membrane subunit [Candidatus Eremiobacteraceae bacterium]